MFGLMKEKDPEIERVVKRLSEKLDNIDEWEVDRAGVAHKTYNLETTKHWITNPENVKIPRYWGKIIQKQISIIHREREKEKLGFVYDILDDKYPYQRHGVADEYLDWLKENAAEDQYVIRGYYIYFSDETLAMGFKLKFD